MDDYLTNNYYLPIGDDCFENEIYNTPNPLNESFTTTTSEISNTTEISDMTSETSNNLDIIDETSNASNSSQSDIWKFFTKEKKGKLVVAKCKRCPSIQYSVIK
ncbi:12059_t:CDS:1, partial [Cetraspora pellucida]